MACTCERCRMRYGLNPEAEKRAEGLLREFLLPEQAQDWEENQAFNVRGSNKQVYRIYPEGGHYGGCIISDYKLQTWNLTNVWPVGLAIPADRALAMMMYLLNDANAVYNNGCHDVEEVELSTYDGKI